MLPYALTIFTGAFLLFLVQPLIGKFILPWFGGSPGVWTTCLLFFQVLLLGGYAYAHLLSTRLRPRGQAWVHGVLLALSLAWLPIVPSERWQAAVETGDPTWRILLLLVATLGLPYFVLSSTGPLLQHWFSRARPGVSPYRLYALSNAGSLLALMSYPFAVEPAFSRQTQAWLWSAGLVLFAGLCGWCAWLARRPVADPVAGAESGGPEPSRAHVESPDPEPTAADKFLWLALPGLASVLLLATTNKLCQDVAVVPFLWVLPLALYLLSFILCFDHPRWYSRRIFGALLALAAAAVCTLLLKGTASSLPRQVIGYATTLFIACMVCHGELYRLKPAPRRLTQFYLFIAAGGALGGVVVAILAPLLFNDYLEFHFGWWGVAYLTGLICLLYRSRDLALGAGVGALLACVAVPALQVIGPDSAAGWWRMFAGEAESFYAEHWPEILALAGVFFACMHEGRRLVGPTWRLSMGAWPLMLSLVFGIALVIQIRSEGRSAVLASRNFYGTLKVYEYYESEPRAHHYVLAHGATTHGMQFTREPQAAWPTSYYGRLSGVGLAITRSPRHSARRLGVVGLGTGSLAAYGETGDTVRFYEINPEVERLARERFTYLAKSPARVNVVLGDARLSLEREVRDGGEPPFDVLVLDAFSSDAIPVHLLTREAFAIYRARMRPDGVIAVHISNRYLDLEPVVEALARDISWRSVTISHDPGEDWWLSRSTWVLVTNNETVLPADAVEASADPSAADRKPVLWTDDRASLADVLKR